MTPKRFRICLHVMGWSQRGLADNLAIEHTTVRRWASGYYPIPENVAEWLETLFAVHSVNRWPKGWLGPGPH